MKKTIILIQTLLLISLFSLINFSENNQLQVNFKNQYSYTTAICENNLCQDFLVSCQNNNLLALSPLTEKIQFSPQWKDPRQNTNSLCDNQNNK